MNTIDDRYQLAPGPQWFYVREHGKAWGIAVEALTAYVAKAEAMRQFAVQGRITSPDALEVTWLHPDAVSQIVSGRQQPLQAPQATGLARPKSR